VTLWVGAAHSRGKTLKPLKMLSFYNVVRGERVRDKIAASKRKGLWVGGPVPLGYRSIAKKLIVVEAPTCFASLVSLNRVLAPQVTMLRDKIKGLRHERDQKCWAGGAPKSCARECLCDAAV
jgi:hypothetical protein